MTEPNLPRRATPPPWPSSRPSSAELERADVDVDVLAAQVTRAAELIGFCRDRIGSARLQIEQVVADLDD